MGDPSKFMEFVGDDQFEEGPVWMMNLLSFEPGNGREVYAEYAARAQEDINQMKGEGLSGGIQVYSPDLFTLSKGQTYDSFAIMQYPSRADFLAFASGTGLKTKTKQEAMNDKKFRIAGLAVQVLVCLKPEQGVVKDPEGPKIFQHRAKL